MAGSTRQQKVSRLIQKELGDIFQRDKKGILSGKFISIAEVKINPDLSVAKVYISMMLTQEKQDVMNQLSANKKEIRKELGQRIRNQVRIIPDLFFYLDQVEEDAQRMEDLLKSLNIPPDSSDQKES